ncbi:hypothetical protein OH779_40600 [Actinacidiphila glaucinigra]|uniref:hypothetical protein n=1 Tax=Actinacidiphila glaucinigra TaxID=235986 RepID=UPI00386EE1F3
MADPQVMAQVMAQALPQVMAQALPQVMAQALSRGGTGVHAIVHGIVHAIANGMVHAMVPPRLCAHRAPAGRWSPGIDLGQETTEGETRGNDQEGGERVVATYRFTLARIVRAGPVTAHPVLNEWAHVALFTSSVPIADADGFGRHPLASGESMFTRTGGTRRHSATAPWFDGVMELLR